MFELAVELTRHVALQAPLDLPGALAFLRADLDVGLGRRVEADSVDHDGVKRSVQLAVAEAVQAVAVGDSRRSGDGCRAGEHGEGRLAADATRVGPGAQDRGGD